MTPWIVALVGALLAALIQGLVFRKRERLLRAKEQCFRFHELRDKLQVLQLEHKINPNSAPYKLLCAIINFAIHNAGAAKLSDMVLLSRTMKQKFEGSALRRLTDDLKSFPEVQPLASEVFGSFADMLVANDDLTYWVFMALDRAAKWANTAVLYTLKPVGRFLSPKRAEVVREARLYRRLGRKLAHSH